jgi:hypothetical protein
MKRVNEVMDCWFESGAMPFAAVHYPFENEKWFKLINAMYERNPILITSNVGLDALPDRFGGAAWSRLCEMCGADGFINMNAIPDQRMKIK